MDKGRYISMKVVIGLWIGVLLVISWDSFAQNTSMKLSETSTLPTTEKRVVNAKKRSSQPEKSGENSA